MLQSDEFRREQTEYAHITDPGGRVKYSVFLVQAVSRQQVSRVANSGLARRDALRVNFLFTQISQFRRVNFSTNPDYWT